MDPIKKLTDLEIIINDEITLFGNTTSIKEEIYHNMWRITFDNDFIKTITKKDLFIFLEKLLEERSLQILEKYPNLKATFYIWYDELAGQLRFNILSGDNVRPPFGCTLNILKSPMPILQKFLDDMQSEHPPLGWENLKIINPGDPGWDEDDNDDNNDKIQNVYVITLPQPTFTNFIKKIIS